MSIAIDTTVSLSLAQIEAELADHVSCTIRYLAPQTWKRLTVAEAAEYAQAGMQLVCNWESGGADLRDLDAATTASHARLAVQQAQADGYPAGCWIYNSGGDFDVTAAEWPRVAANLRIIRPIYRAGGYGLGLYSSWDALTWARRDGLVDGYWQSQSTSFSGRRNAQTLPFAHLRQHAGTTIAGVSCDPNEILIPAFGQAGAMNGGTMLRDDPDGIYLFNRVQSLYHLNPQQGGPEKGATGELVAAILEIRANAAKAAGGVPVALTDADRAAIVADLKAALAGLIPSAADIAKAVNDDAAHRLES